MAEGDGWALITIVALVGFAGVFGTTSTTPATNPSSFPTIGNPTTGGSTGTSTVPETARAPEPGQTNIPGGAVAACPGTVVFSGTENGLTLRIFYSPEAGGTNCSSVTRTGAVDANSYLTTEIRVSRTFPESNSWPDYAAVGGAFGADMVTGAYVTGTTNLCVTANGKYFPAGGEPVAIVRRPPSLCN